MIITIDGPVASGKTSVARLLALRFNYFHISSGLLYRAFALFIKQKKCLNLEKDFFLECIHKCIIRYENTSEKMPLVFINDVLIDQKDLNSDEISDTASLISTFPEIRSEVFRLQHLFAESKNTIIDGRDCGTVVFPHAKVKIFLTASPEIRAQRLCNRQHQKNISECLTHVVTRDARDAERTHSPMRPASGALIIDNSHFTLDQTLVLIEQEVKRVIH